MSNNAEIDVYFTNINYLSKVVVTNNISEQTTYLFPNSPNTTIQINVLPSFNYPSSIISWGHNFFDGGATKLHRMVGLFNQSACRIDFDETNRLLTFTNASLTNLGVCSTTGLPATET